MQAYAARSARTRIARAPQNPAATPKTANIGHSEIAAPSQPRADRATIRPIESAQTAASRCCAARACGMGGADVRIPRWSAAAGAT